MRRKLDGDLWLNEFIPRAFPSETYYFDDVTCPVIVLFKTQNRQIGGEYSFYCSINERFWRKIKIIYFAKLC